MKPLMSLRNLTPSSTALASPASATGGAVVAEFQRLHGQVRVTVTPLDGTSMFPLSSMPRLLIVIAPMPVTGNTIDQLSRPFARCQVAPESIDTSTADTRPELSVAVPLIVRLEPDTTDVPAAGTVITDTGATRSVEGNPGVKPG